MSLFTPRKSRTLLPALMAGALLYVYGAFALPATAADRAPIERSLLLRQQQSDSLSLRNRQAAQELRARSLDREDQSALRSRHAQQRREQDALHSQQLRHFDTRPVMPDTPEAQRAARRAERARLEQESAQQLQHFGRTPQPGLRTYRPGATRNAR